MGFFKRLNANGGFAFIEAVLGTLILGVGLCSSLMMISNVNAHISETDRTTIATQLASEKLEDILADRVFKGYDEVTTSEYPQENLQGEFQGFKRTITIIEVSSSDLETAQAGSGTKKVSVKVSWGDAADDQVTVEMLVGDYT